MCSMLPFLWLGDRPEPAKLRLSARVDVIRRDNIDFLLSQETLRGCSGVVRMIVIKSLFVSLLLTR